MTPEQAFFACIQQLSLELSRGSFNSWVSNARLVSFENKEMIIGVPTDANQAWLESRLASTMQRILTGMLDLSGLSVKFVVEETPPEEELNDLSEERETGFDQELSAESGEVQQLKLESVENSLYSILVQPDRIVTAPEYLLRFIPLVGADVFWLTIAFRQVCFLKTVEGNRNRPFTARADEIYRWAGMSRATFWRQINNPRLGWFVDKLSSAGWTVDATSGKTKQLPNRYRIAADIPLTPMDAESLRNFLLQAGIANDPILALESAIKNAPDKILVYPPPRPTAAQKEMKPVPLSVFRVVKNLLDEQEITPKIVEMIDDLTAKIIRPRDNLQLSWYFLQEWLPLLGAGPALLVTLLRSLCYYSPVTGELRDDIEIDGGYAQLARYLGMEREKTIVGWLPTMMARGPRTQGTAVSSISEQNRNEQIQRLLSSFLSRHDYHVNNASSYGWKFHVLMDAEPLTPGDSLVIDWTRTLLEDCQKRSVLGLLKTWIQQETVSNYFDQISFAKPNSIIETLENSVIPLLRLSKSDNSIIETLDPVVNSIIETLGSERIPYLRLLIVLSGLKTLIQIPEDQTTTDEPLDSDSDEPLGVVWNLENILTANHVSPKRRDSLLNQEKSAVPFVSWLLYATGANGKAINDPIGFTISKLLENPTEDAGGEFKQLAELKAGILGKLIIDQLILRNPGGYGWHNYAESIRHSRLVNLAKTLSLQVPELNFYR